MANRQQIKDALNTAKQSPGSAVSINVLEDDYISLINGGVHLFIGTGGDVKVDMEDEGEEITFTNVPNGSFLAIRVSKVYAEGTTALGIVGVY